jgi:hypothetical protein
MRSGEADSRPRCAIGLFDLGMKGMAPERSEGKRRAISRAFGEKMSRRGRGVLRRTGDGALIGKEELFCVPVWDEYGSA